jgi:hypothetical protein
MVSLVYLFRKIKVKFFPEEFNGIKDFKVDVKDKGNEGE